MTDTTVENLAARLAALGPERRRLLRQRLLTGDSADAEAPEPVPRDDRPMPASFFQERLWLLDQMVPGSSAYLSWFVLRIDGDLRVDLLTMAWEVLVARHEVLRSALARVDGQLVQVVRDAVPVPVEVLDVRSDDEPLDTAHRLLRTEASTGFDLARAPLLRVRVVRTGDREHLLGLFLHHTITDGWSNGVLLAELGRVYRSLLAGREPELAPLRLQYADAVAWQRRRLTGSRLDELLAFWSRQLRDTPELFALPLDRPRRVGVPPRGGNHGFDVPMGSVAGLRELARQEKATSFMVVLAGLAATLARWSGQADVVVGNSRSGRSHPDLDNVVGPLVDTVVLRLDTSGEPTGRELVRRARRVTMAAHAQAELPFDRLVEHLRPRRSTTYHPVFQVNLGVRDFPHGGLTLPGTTVQPTSVAGVRPVKFDLSVYLTTGVGGWSGTLEYNAELFDAETMTRLADGLRALLGGLAEDPDRPIGALPAAGLNPVNVPSVPPPAPEITVSGRTSGLARTVIAPRDRWERDVAQAWSQVLGIDPVGATDDFFAIGGHSMAGMLAIERIQQITGRRVSLATLFRHPTVESLAATLRGMDTDIETPFVVALQPHGTLPPLFFTPPALGELAPYFSLMRELGTGRPLCGLQADGFFRHGDPGDLPLSAQAAKYAEEIVRSGVDGPYHLCGFSAAGRLAVAVADQLAGLGRSVGAVVLLDSAPYGDVAPDPDLATVLARWLDFAPPAAELSALDRDGQVARVLAAGVRAGSLPPSMSGAEFRDWCRRLEFGARALAGHGPLGFPGTLTLLHRAGRTDRDLPAEWHGLPVGGLRAVPVVVDNHLSFIEGRSVPEVARLIAGCLAGADGDRAE